MAFALNANGEQGSLQKRKLMSNRTSNADLPLGIVVGTGPSVNQFNSPNSDHIPTFTANFLPSLYIDHPHTHQIPPHSLKSHFPLASKSHPQASLHPKLSPMIIWISCGNVDNYRTFLSNHPTPNPIMPNNRSTNP